jgi:hypothetical protein
MQPSTKQKPRPKTNATSDATNTDIRKRMQYVMQQSPTSKNKCNVRFYKYPIRKHKQLSKWQTSTSENKYNTCHDEYQSRKQMPYMVTQLYSEKQIQGVCVWGGGVGGLGFGGWGGGWVGGLKGASAPTVRNAWASAK